MKTLTQALVGTLAGALALGTASPAMAQYARHYGYARAGDPRSAVAQCVSAAQRSADRYAYGHARVTGIRDVDARRDGYTVKGRIAVRESGRHWRGGNRYYRNGWNNRARGYDTGSFTCRVRYGQVAYLDFHGIRGL